MRFYYHFQRVFLKFDGSNHFFGHLPVVVALKQHPVPPVFNHVRDASYFTGNHEQSSLESLQNGNRHIVEPGRRHHDVRIVQIAVDFRVGNLADESDILKMKVAYILLEFRPQGAVTEQRQRCVRILLLDGIEGITFVNFSARDTVRSRIVQRIIDAYEKN